MFVLRRTQEILETEGLIALLKRSFLFAISPIFRSKTCFLRTRRLEAISGLNEADFRPNIDDLTLKVISSNQEADKLEAQGFGFRSVANIHNEHGKKYKQWLDQGAVACCAFVGQEFAAIVWVILSQKVQDLTKIFPQKVNYSQNEATLKSTWVNEKYRGKGLFQYNVFFNADKFMIEKGITTLKTVSLEENIIGHKLGDSLGSRPYAKASCTEFLWWKLWKETPI